MMQPNFSSNDFMTSTGIAEPPETHSRRLDTSVCSASGACSIAENIVGTPSKIVTLSRSMTDSALAPSNLGIRVRVEPRSTVVFRPQVRPKTWNSGRQPMTTSSVELSSRVSAVVRALPARLACVSSAPFGCPVVPDV
jgi:hypothetical protein